LPQEKSTSRDNLKRLAAFGGMAIEMSVSVGAGTVFGYLLDKQFKTSPALTIVFMFVGLLGGVVTFIRMWRFLKHKIQ
jgi:F0F1-type ATP synthase assembly protein I